MKLLSYGPRALLAEFGSLEDVIGAAAAWRSAGLPGVVDVVPAARTVLIVHDGTFDATLLRGVQSATAVAGPIVEVPVRYDGEDLDDVAAAIGTTRAGVIELHSTPIYSVAFCGFMPGFSYLVGVDARLQVPRRSTPRTRVPAGSVAVASEFTAVYPRSSPGGWHLLGSTELEMWVEHREPPATLPPGSQVRFVPR